jgi:hypothetical protein
MRLDELKNDFPETPEFIHEMVLETVAAQLEDEKKIVSISGKKKRKKRVLRTAFIAAACVLTATIAYAAGSRIYQIYLEKKGSYGIEAKIESEESAKKLTIPKKIDKVKIEPGYIPEGMEWSDESHIQYPETPYLGGFSLSSVLLDSNSFEAVLQETGVVESEQRTFGTREGIYLQFQDMKQDGSFDKRIYLLCPEEYQMLIIYIGDDISKEDAVKFAENISLVKTGEQEETSGLYTWSDYLNPETEYDSDIGEPITCVPESELKIWKVGDTIEITGSGEDASGGDLELPGILIRLDEVQIADDLSLLEGKAIPEEWQNAAGSDGKLLDSTFSYIKSGDGIETLDEVVRTEAVKQKLVYAVVTYENPTETEINHMLYLGTLAAIKHKDGKYEMYWESSGEDYDKIREDGVAHTAEMTYYSIKEDYGNGGNYIPALKPGESVQVEMAWIVNEKELEDAYLDLTGDAGYLQFTEKELKYGLFDISTGE